MRVVNLSAELPHKTFLPVSRRKIIITGSVLAALSILLIFLNPSTPANERGLDTTLLVLVTSIILLLLALLPPKSLIKSIDIKKVNDQLIVNLSLSKELSGILEVGQLTATESVLDESVQTVYQLQQQSTVTLNQASSIQAVLPGGAVAGLLTKKGEGMHGLIRCPGLRLSVANGPEIFLAWIRPARSAIEITLNKSNLYLQGAQCSLSYGSLGGVNFLVSAADRAGKLFSGKVILKLLRTLSQGTLNLKHEEIISEVKSGGMGSGNWRPSPYIGEEILIVFDRSRSVREIMSELKMREFIADPVPNVEYAIVLESRRNSFQWERDVANLTIKSSREEEHHEERA